MTWALLPLGLLVLASSAAIDYAHARYAYARDAGQRWRAAAWSTAQWCSSCVGFLLVVKVSLWLLPFEACGLALGTFLAVKPRSGESPRAPTRTME